ncbi:MAG: hypothetical protein FJ290_12865 [Planctomycetes bacterium]|nr:hypothetical protein [Planctomycetota bacterium]
MPNIVKAGFLKELRERYGALRKLSGSQSLYELGSAGVVVYIRYSKLHEGQETWNGLRQDDLRMLEGRRSAICFIWPGQPQPLILPYSEYEDVFHTTIPNRDGQYKAQIYLRNEGTQLCIVRAGRFNVEAYYGWDKLDALVSAAGLPPVPDLTHSQVQTLLGAIGTAKSYDVWVPRNDRMRLDWSLTAPFGLRDELPHGFGAVERVLEEVDVIWIPRGSGELRALFEVEHTTPVYSALLRFNDIHLIAPTLRPQFSVVASDQRRGVFVEQLRRPTFQSSGLCDLCTFLEYANVFRWYHELKSN